MYKHNISNYMAMEITAFNISCDADKALLSMEIIALKLYLYIRYIKMYIHSNISEKIKCFNSVI